MKLQQIGEETAKDNTMALLRAGQTVEVNIPYHYATSGTSEKISQL